MRALADILEFDLEIGDLPGARNYIQDALSRRPDYKDPPIIEKKIPNIPITTFLITLDLENKET
jgi:hypothetical protein